MHLDQVILLLMEKHIEFYVRSIAGLLFIIAYSYLFVELFNRLNTNSSNLKHQNHHMMVGKQIIKMMIKKMYHYLIIL